MKTILLEGKQGHSIKFSPDGNTVLVAANECYGLSGTGTLLLFKNGPWKYFNWANALLDCVWIPTSFCHVASASSDGTIQLWDLNKSRPSSPVMIFKEHKSDACCIDISRTQMILSTSWDSTLKIWDPNISNSIRTINVEEQSLVHNGVFSPFNCNNILVVTSKGFLKLGSILNPQKDFRSIKSHDFDALSCDWSKFNENLVVTCGSEGLIKFWDIRNIAQPVIQLFNGKYPIKKVKFSPHNQNILASVGFDYATKIWNFAESFVPKHALKNHTEFVYGLDWNSFNKYEIADCGLDRIACIFNVL